MPGTRCAEAMPSARIRPAAIWAGHSAKPEMPARTWLPTIAVAAGPPELKAT